MTGMWRREASSLIARVRSSPLVPGIITSVSTRSGRFFFISSSASAPSPAASTSYVSFRHRDDEPTKIVLVFGDQHSGNAAAVEENRAPAAAGLLRSSVASSTVARMDVRDAILHAAAGMKLRLKLSPLHDLGVEVILAALQEEGERGTLTDLAFHVREPP